MLMVSRVAGFSRHCYFFLKYLCAADTTIETNEEALITVFDILLDAQFEFKHYNIAPD